MLGQTVRLRIFGASTIVALLAFNVCSCATKVELPELDPEWVREAKAYLDAHHQTPEDYIVGEFADHDVVFIGESHYIKHVPLLVQSLIPGLHANGIHTLATEFARRKDQPLIDSLLAAAQYDESLAREIQFRQYVHFGFEEYVSIYEAAWNFNRQLEPNEPRFRILGVNNSPDWSHIKTKEDREDGNMMKKVWKGQTEGDWAKVILDEVDRGEKVLVYSGMHHAFSKYKQPLVEENTGRFYRFEDGRMGNHVHAALGERAVTISLHAPWPSDKAEYNAVYPVGGYIDALMQELGPKYYPVGFDTHGTPFGDLQGPGSMYQVGYDSFVLEDFCDGYVFIKPIPEYEGVTVIRDFVNEDNIERARLQSPNPKRRDASIERFYFSAVNAADIESKYDKFK